MFAKSVINSAMFLRMPASARLLYYDLGMEADDDGFVEAFTVIRKTASGEEDLKTLEGSGFVIICDPDLLVSWIPHWTVNNSIRGDRYHESKYKKVYALLTSEGIPGDNHRDTNGIPGDNHRDTESSLGKISLGEESLGEAGRTDRLSPSVSDVISFARRNNIQDETAKKFWQYNEDRNWMTAGGPVKDWKAALLAWAAREREGKRQEENTGKPWWIGGIKQL